MFVADASLVAKLASAIATVAISASIGGAAHLLEAPHTSSMPLANARDSIAVTRERNEMVSTHDGDDAPGVSGGAYIEHLSSEGLLLLEAELLARLDQVQALLEERGERTSGGDEDGAADEVDAFQPGKRLPSKARDSIAVARGRQAGGGGGGVVGGAEHAAFVPGKIGTGKARDSVAVAKSRQAAKGAGDHDTLDTMAEGDDESASFTATTVKFGVGEHAPAEAEAAAASPPPSPPAAKSRACAAL